LPIDPSSHDPTGPPESTRIAKRGRDNGGAAAGGQAQAARKRSVAIAGRQRGRLCMQVQSPNSKQTYEAA